jgi:hypothetical protein
MSKEFITFGCGSQNFIDAGNRLLEQAKALHLFDKTTFFTDEILKNDPIFWNQHKSFIEKNNRGYGYWLWKPYLIKKTMDQMKDGDLLLYLDAGCEIDCREKDYLIKCFEQVKKDYIIGSPGCFPRQMYTKMDLFIYLDMNNDHWLNSVERQAGINLFLVCDKTRELVNQWYETTHICDYHYLDDSPSNSPNTSDFREHRHDQAIFDLLTKKYNLYSTMTLNKCIRAHQNRSGVSKL